MGHLKGRINKLSVTFRMRAGEYRLKQTRPTRCSDELAFSQIRFYWHFVQMTFGIPVNWLCINSSKAQAFFVSTCPIIGGKFAYTRKLLHFCVTDITLSTSHTGSTSRPRVNFMNHPKEIFERNCWDDESFHRWANLYWYLLHISRET